MQNAIDAIAKNGEKLTIIMIAHRLTTIASADNLLYFKGRSQLISAAKGSPEYEEIFEKLKCIQYAYGDEEKDDHAGEEEDGEIIEEEDDSSDGDRIDTGIANSNDIDANDLARSGSIQHSDSD